MLIRILNLQICKKDNLVFLSTFTYLCVCCARHVHPVDLYDLVSGLKPPVLGDETLLVDLLNHHATLKKRGKEKGI